MVIIVTLVFPKRLFQRGTGVSETIPVLAMAVSGSEAVVALDVRNVTRRTPIDIEQVERVGEYRLYQLQGIRYEGNRFVL